MSMIQQRLDNEAGTFQRGDYSDPAKPNICQGFRNFRPASQIKVSYPEVAARAAIIFANNESPMVIHRWFGAQLPEHSGRRKAE